MNRSTEGLRDVLFDTLEKFQSGKVDSAHVKAITSLTNGILATVAKDLEAIRLLDELQDPNKPKSLGEMRLSLPLSAKTDVVDAVPRAPIPPASASEPLCSPEPSPSPREPDEPQTAFGRQLVGVIRDAASGVTRHKGTRY